MQAGFASFFLHARQGDSPDLGERPALSRLAAEGPDQVIHAPDVEFAYTQVSGRGNRRCAACAACRAGPGSTQTGLDNTLPLPLMLYNRYRRQRRALAR